MNPRLLLALVPLFLWQCATPRLPEPPRIPGPDDDHRLVSTEEFRASSWDALPPLISWKPEPAGISAVLKDGRTLRLEFVAPSVLRWWVPAAAGEEPLSPGAVYPAAKISAAVKEFEGGVSIATSGLVVSLRWEDFSWSLGKGDKVVLSTRGGPRAAGRRLVQAFHSADAVKWRGPGLSDDQASGRYWIGDETSWAVPALLGAGGTLPFAIVLDNSYQTYARIASDETSLGALNGGLDLLVSAGPNPTVPEALTAFMGRPALPPLWGLSTGLVLPENEAGDFLRRAKLSIETAVGLRSRPLFRVTAPTPPGEALPDLASQATRQGWAVHRGIPELPAGAGMSLDRVAGRQDWDARFGDVASPLARMNNLLPGLEALAVSEAWQARNPGLRPFLRAANGGLGSVRYALPEIRVVAGNESGEFAQALIASAAGLGTPAVRLDLTPLANPDTRAAAYQSLLNWMLNPVLTLDWGADPAQFWAALPERDRTRLKAILDRRAQFKPLFAQLTRLASTSGRPVWQPLWWAFPDAPPGEFLLGDLLAAPGQGGPTQSVYLPGPGIWFDFWSGEEFGGGRSYELAARPDKPILFARGGAFVPSREAETFEGKDVYAALTIHVFPGGRGAGTYLLDDGLTQAWKTGGAWETRLLYDFSQKDMSIEQVSVGTTGAVKPDPYVLYRIHNVFRPRLVKVDGKAVTLFGDSWGITDTDRSAAWYESDHTLLIKAFRPDKDQVILVNF